MNQNFPKSARLRNSRQYRYVLNQGTELRGKFLILRACKNSKKNETKLGVVASRHFGNATQRNRFKRLSREAFRLSKFSLPKGAQLVLKPRKYALEASLKQILEELRSLAHQILEKN